MVTIHLSDIVSELKHIVAAKYTVNDICLFGSNARGEATKDSDIDIFLQMSFCSLILTSKHMRITCRSTTIFCGKGCACDT
jgi:predicted nucleotidyltransferase